MDNSIERIPTAQLAAIQGYAYEMHLHTGEIGFCAKVPAATLVAEYEDAGYAGIVVTNHYQRDFFNSFPETTWEGKVQNYLRGFHAAQAAVKKADFNVILGIELRFLENFNDYLVYGISEQELVDYPYLYEMVPESFKKLADERGWIIIQAHPYRRNCQVIAAEYLHGIEVFNENPRHENYNQKALDYAREHNLIMSCGSDYHQLEDIARAAVVFDEPITDTKELAKRFFASKQKNQASESQHRLITWNQSELLIK